MQVNQKKKQSQGNPEKVVIPAKAGIQNLRASWAPAFAGVTINDIFRTSRRHRGFAAMLWLFNAGVPISQTTPNAPSGGRVESLCKGLSGMDAARAAMGQGWHFVGGPHPVGPLEQRWNEET